MKRICRRALSAAAVLALTGGFAAATALPAAAAPGPVNYAYGASAQGLVNVFPVAEARYPGLPPVASIAHINVAHIVGVGPVLDTAGPDGSASHIGHVNVLGSIGLPALTVRAASSSCTIDSETGDASGETTLFGGLLNSGLSFHFLPVHPAPNTTVTVPGIATVTLNKQVTNGSRLTVTALSVAVFGGVETINVGVSVCTGEDT